MPSSSSTLTAAFAVGTLVSSLCRARSMLKRGIVGNIYKGHVQNVLPGMQAAFVDIGQEKNAFLYIGDGLPHDAPQGLALPHQKIHIGQNLPVEIIKDATGIKGPRATTHLTLLLMPAWLPGRYMGLKQVSVFPGNAVRGLPSIFGSYLLSSAVTGELLAIIDGGELTARRTAAASALAAFINPLRGAA